MADARGEHTELLAGDDELLDRVRAGDTGAFGTLWERHVDAARGLARQLVRGEAEVDDAVADAFARVLDVLQRGGGPSAGFRPYLLTALRHCVYDRGRKDKRQVVTDDMERFDSGEPFVDPALEGLERSLIARAFLSLRPDWQSVLWYTEIEGLGPAEAAGYLGKDPGSVAAMAYRAREGLRRAYLQMHLAGGAPAESCRPALELLGGYVRGGLAKRDTAVVERHLDDCAQCREVCAELMDVNVGLRGLVLPLIAGPAAAGYLASLPSGALAGGWWTRMSKGQQQATAAGTAATAVAAAVALALVGADEPLPPPGSPPPAAAPPAQDPPQEAPPGADPPQAPPAGPPADPPADPPANPPAEEDRPQDPPPEDGPDPDEPAPDEPDPEDPPAPEEPGRPAFAARVDPVGSLVPGRPGIVVMSVANEGDPAVDDVIADILLPRGVSFGEGGGPGSTVPFAPGQDGWSCTPSDQGARCVRSGLDAGESTTEYLDVDVDGGAPAGNPPRIRVSSGGESVSAGGTYGVDPEGTPARYATAGRVRVESVGNALLTCEDPEPPEEDHDHGHDHGDWPWWPGVVGGGHDHGHDHGHGRHHGDQAAAPPADERPAPAAPDLSDAPEGQEGPTSPADPGGPEAPEAPSPPTPAPPEEPEKPEAPDKPSPEKPEKPETPAPEKPGTPEPPEYPEEPEPPETGPGPCSEAQQRQGEQRDNDLWDMVPLDLDSDPGTRTSSSARWTLPSGGSVRWAGLYFSGVGDPGAASARIKGPGSSSYTGVAASDVRTAELPGYTSYHAFADVTSQVRAGGGGEWWVADVPGEEGVSTYAGWSLVVVLEDPSERFNQAMVLDDAAAVFHGDGVRFPLAGLLPAAVSGTVDVAAWEGDADLPGDRVLLNGSPLTPSGGDRDPDNAFASHARGGVGPPLAFGTDVVRFPARLPRDPEIRLEAEGDAVLAGVVAVTAPLRT
ncbi:sigma-70 family RNA polymerase sigma factor [Nocardiopsis chromatogenes]|uniref:sigma-70 family RNA polymerase sigma factor n=1 Tax=Nocardiopsis chromatogenes TaxID=280239 RepID=UPI0003467B72|nr:sigma-70 family RNA polymerase sigma factor [Nocardiopsis chromatogenes]